MFLLLPSPRRGNLEAAYALYNAQLTVSNLLQNDSCGKCRNYGKISIGETKLKTLTIPETRQKVRVIYKKINDGNIIQIGITLKDDEELIKSYRYIFLIAIAVMITIGSILGWFITRRAMSGVVRVTKAAVAIGQGNFSFRVPLGNEGIEVQNMVKAFDDMVIKIELLMKGG